MKAPPWSPDEVAYLKETYPRVMRISDLSLKRTPKAIGFKAQELKVKLGSALKISEAELKRIKNIVYEDLGVTDCLATGGVNEFSYFWARNIFITICKRNFKTDSYDLSDILFREIGIINRGMREMKKVEKQTDFISLSIRMAYLRCEAKVKHNINQVVKELI